MKFGISIMALIMASVCTASNSKTIDITDVQLAGPGLYYIINDTVPGYGSETIYDSPLVFTQSDGTKIYVNCDDLVHNIGTGPQNLSFTVGNIGSNFRGGNYTAQQIGSMAYLDKMMNSIVKNGGKYENVKLAAEQLASWEVSNPDVTFSGVDPTVQTLASIYTIDAKNKWAPNNQLTSLNGSQSQTFSTSVPEPKSWLMMLVGLGSVGALLRFRNVQNSLKHKEI